MAITRKMIFSEYDDVTETNTKRLIEVAGEVRDVGGMDRIVFDSNFIRHNGVNYETTLLRPPRNEADGTITLVIGDNRSVFITNTVAVTVNLPTAVGNAGQRFLVKKLSAVGAPRDITVDPFGSQTIDGATTHLLNVHYEYVIVESDGTNWMIVG